MQVKTFLLHPILPYNLNLSLQRLRRDPIYIFEKEAVYRTLKVNQSLYLLKIYFQKHNEKTVKVESVCLDGNMEPEKVQNTLERMLSIDQELQIIYDIMNQLPNLSDLTKTFCGLHIFQEPDLFQCMVKLIIAQQINTSFAAELTRNLIEGVSETVQYGHQTYSVFPSASQITSHCVDDLVKRKFNQRKAEYIIDFAQDVHNGKIDLSKLKHLSDSAVMDELLKVRGIGPWTAQCFMIFGLGRKNIVPESDIGIQKAVQNVYKLKGRPKKNDVLRLSETWHPIGSYVTRYLWETLRS
ncbi:DNA-3-methyladenine glycosylase family protein [Scopulibacillus cellulosilyticus]|uniref:DNA-3-methyladenine glycosylase II n=1 Tax=Scopulibacillus cellulosilyticus TaxID=2665665 RepID=A0ABW2PSD6_9BACL